MADAKHMAKPGQRVNSGHEDTRTDIGKRGWKKLAISVVAWFIAVLATAGLLLVGPLPFSDNPILGAAVARFAASLVLIVVLILLGGRSWLRITGSGLVYTFKRAWMLLLIGIVPAGISYFKAATGNGFPADFLPNLGFVALLCIGIGMLEEGLFRGIELNGLLAGLGGELLVHVGPLEVLAVGGVGEVLGGGGHLAAVEQLEPQLGVLLLVLRGLLEDCGDLHIAVLLGLGSVIVVLVARLGFPGERRHQVGLGP